MNNTIKYFYNINPSKIVRRDDKYKIIQDDNVYYLIPVDDNVEDLNFIYQFLIQKNIYCHEIIANKNNNIFTLIEQKQYILLKIYIPIRRINIMDVYDYAIHINSDDCKWYNLWTKKIDYYSYQVSQLKIKFPQLHQSFYYYNGLCENAISLLNNINGKINNYISHKRILKNCDSFEFYNPVNLTIDTRARDVCEYIKMLFFYDNSSNENFLDIIKNNNWNYNEAILIMSRMLYPSYYFDMYDLIIQNKESEEKISIITDKSNEYEQLLRNIYNYLNYNYKIPEIEWLKKT